MVGRPCHPLPHIPDIVRHDRVRVKRDKRLAALHATPQPQRWQQRLRGRGRGGGSAPEEAVEAGKRQRHPRTARHHAVRGPPRARCSTPCGTRAARRRQREPRGTTRGHTKGAPFWQDFWRQNPMAMRPLAPLSSRALKAHFNSWRAHHADSFEGGLTPDPPHHPHPRGGVRDRTGPPCGPPPLSAARMDPHLGPSVMASGLIDAAVAVAPTQAHLLPAPHRPRWEAHAREPALPLRRVGVAGGGGDL